MANTYSLYKNGALIKSKLTCADVQFITGMSREMPALYAKNNHAYKKQYTVKVDGESEHKAFTYQLEKQWNEIYEAARRIKNGGKIVFKNGKRYVEGGL